MELRKTLLEQMAEENFYQGYRIGGIAYVSKLCAEELKRCRTKEKKAIVLEVNKLRGMKKVEFLFK